MIFNIFWQVNNFPFCDLYPRFFGLNHFLFFFFPLRLLSMSAVKMKKYKKMKSTKICRTDISKNDFASKSAIIRKNAWFLHFLNVVMSRKKTCDILTRPPLHWVICFHTWSSLKLIHCRRALYRCQQWKKSKMQFLLRVREINDFHPFFFILHDFFSKYLFFSILRYRLA